MKFNNKNIKLVIFDLDGTLIASTSIWADIDKIFFEKRGMGIPPLYNMEIAHVGLTKAAEITVRKYLPNEKEEDVIKEWVELSFEAYRDYIPLKNNARELLELLYKNGVHIALATANSKDIYEVCLSRLDILKYFSFVVDVNSCKEGKNSPEIYDRVCERFNVNRDETLIFEDMLTALKTAYSNGFNVIGVYDDNSTSDIKECEDNSHLFIRDFKEIIDLLLNSGD